MESKLAKRLPGPHGRTYSVRRPAGGPPMLRCRRPQLVCRWPFWSRKLTIHVGLWKRIVSEVLRVEVAGHACSHRSASASMLARAAASASGLDQDCNALVAFVRLAPLHDDRAELASAAGAVGQQGVAGRKLLEVAEAGALRLGQPRRHPVGPLVRAHGRHPARPSRRRRLVAAGHTFFPSGNGARFTKHVPPES